MVRRSDSTTSGIARIALKAAWSPIEAYSDRRALSWVNLYEYGGGFDLAIFRANMAGAGFVLVCSLTFALYSLASDRWTPRIGSVPFTVYAMTAATGCLVVHYAAFGEPHALPVDLEVAGLFAGLVVIATVFAMLAMSEGVRRIGAQRAAVVSTVGPPITILLGAFHCWKR